MHGIALCALCALCLLPALLSGAETKQPLPAFPGATGFGATSEGGRGGRVIHVTSLADSGPGSLREAMQAKGPRIVVFDVGGVIELDSTLDIPPGNGRITIAGQTAPGGISLMGAGLGLPFWNRLKPRPKTTDIIIRHLRVRGLHHTLYPSENGDCIQIYHADRIIIDHCSFTGSADEMVDGSGSNELSLQWCSFEESALWGQGGAQHAEGDHNLGILLAYSEDCHASMHHNLLAHHRYRMPLFKGGKVFDFRNNTVYNWWKHAITCRATVGGNFVGNSYIMGPDNERPYLFGANNENIYLADNQLLPKFPHPVEQAEIVAAAYKPQTTTLLQAPVAAPPAPEVDPDTATERVLARVGAWPRDATTRRTIDEVRTRSGSFGLSGPYERFPERADGLCSAQHDSDRDGMPDAWERRHGLNPSDPEDGNGVVPAGASPDDRHAGYRWIEYFLNERAEAIVATEPDTVTVAVTIEGPGRIVAAHGGRSKRWRSKRAPKQVPWGEQAVLNRGSQIRLRAIAQDGHSFVGWSGGGLSGNEATTTLTADNDSTVTARFK